MLRGVLLFPLHGAFLIIGIAVHVVIVVAFIDALTHPDAAYISTEKQSKTFWLLALAVGFFLTLIGLIAAIVYLVDVRPAVRGASGGRDRGY